MMILLSIVALVTLGFAGTAYYREKQTVDPRHRDDGASVTFWLRVTVIDFALIVLITVFNCVGMVPTGNVGVPVIFGKVIEGKVLPEGIYLKNPCVNVRSMSIQRRSMTRHVSQAEGEEGSLAALSKDNLALDIDVTFAWVLSDTYLPQFLRKIGGDERYEVSLIYPTSGDALRKAASEFSFTGEGSHEALVQLAERTTLEFQTAVNNQLRGVKEFEEFTDEQLEDVIKVLPTSVRRIMPPKDVLAAISQKVAAKQELERQDTLVEIALKRKEVQENDGASISGFFAALPPELAPADKLQAYTQFTNRRQMEAVADALDKGTITTMYIGAPGMNVSAK